MNRKNTVIAVALCARAFSANAAPVLNVTPGGLQGGNWVWDVSVTPDLTLTGGNTPLAVELGFRLSSDPLVSVTNVNPSVFDTNNPGVTIFGWETTFGFPFPEGLEVTCTSCTANNPATFGGHAAAVVAGTANEIFTALGSIDIATPGPQALLKIIAKGPANGGPSSSTIEWLGAYSGKGRIAQISGASATNFDIYSGTATQVPEPVGCSLMLIGSAIALLRNRTRR